MHSAEASLCGVSLKGSLGGPGWLQQGGGREPFLSNASPVMVKGFRNYSTTVFVVPSLPLPFVPALSSLSASIPLMQNCPFSMPKTCHCGHTQKCASANACCANRCWQNKAAEQHEAQTRAAEQHSTEAAGLANCSTACCHFRSCCHHSSYVPAATEASAQGEKAEERTGPPNTKKRHAHFQKMLRFQIQLTNFCRRNT